MKQGYFVWICLMSFVAFIMYGIDKYCAIHNKWRIRERDLLLLAWIGGSFGAFLGMQIMHHKTLHRSFRIQVPLACILWICIGVFLFLR